MPPATRTRPSASSVAVCAARSTSITAPAGSIGTPPAPATAGNSTRQSRATAGRTIISTPEVGRRFPLGSMACCPSSVPRRSSASASTTRDHAEEQGVDLPGAATAVREVAEHAHRARRANRHPVDHRAGRLRGGARGRHRQPREPGLARERARSGRRLHLRERRLGARPPVLRRPVDSRQVARHVLPRRPSARARLGCRRPAGARHPRDPQRPGDAGVDDGQHGLRRGRDRRLREPGDHARTRRSHPRRARRQASESSATRPCCCSPATRSPSRSTASARSPTP